MGEIKEFPAKREAVTDIAKNLTKNAANIRTLVVLGREASGELFVMLHAKDDAPPEDMLILQRILGTVVDTVWEGSLDSSSGG